MTAGSRGAIDAALDRVYPGTRDFRMGLQPAADEQVPPLAEIVAYRAATHWHYITYGLSELEGKTSRDPALSGFGVEYTLKVVDPADSPPMWPFHVLRWLAKTTWETRQPYDPGHSGNLPYPTLVPEAGIDGFVFFEDETLRTIDTPTGAITFVQAVELRRGEYALLGAWDALAFEAELRALSGDRLWRPGRASVLDGPRGDAIRAAVDRDGSSQSVDFAEVACGPEDVRLDGVGVQVFDKFLRHRLAHGRAAKVMGPQRTIELEPGAWHYDHGAATTVVRVPPHEARALADDIARAANDTTIHRPGGVTLRIDRRG